jgi:choline dehydrogenase-like flavoprotein
MIADLDATEGELPEYDLCVIGSGPAGMTVAAELAGSGLRIAVLESGLARPTRHGDRLREVESEGIHVKAYSRERVLGGASTTWAGLSSPLDESDMQERPFLRSSGWPIPRAELCALYAEAAERYRFPALPLFEPTGFGALRARGDLQPTWQGLEEKVFLAADEPQDFGREWRHVCAAADADLWLDATVLALEVDGGRVSGARVRTRGGRERRVAARAYVLATGGIENARLLLASDIGGDQVGRWLMNHPKNYYGCVRLREPVRELPYYFGCLHQGFAGYAGLRLPTAVQAQRGLLNSYVRLEPLFPWSDNDGVESLVLFVKHSKLLFTFWKKRHRDEVVELRDYSETGDDSDLSNQRRTLLGWAGLGFRVLRHLPSVTRYVLARVSRRRPRVTRARVRNFMEMEPDPENRVTLSSTTRDPYDRPLPVVRHRPSALDRRSMIAVHEALARELERTGIGTLEGPLAELDPWPIDQDASHHMGTTRMGTERATSVVDVTLRVHGVRNLFVAGASVFPTSGCANPTFTIVALSIRLARHLRAELAEGAA